MSRSAFEVENLGKAWSRGDAQAVMDLYADDLEQTEIDAAHPAPQSVSRSKAEFRTMVEKGIAAGVRMELRDFVPGAARAAYGFTCHAPGGGRVVGNSIVEIRDGRIVRETVVQARGR